MKYRPCRTQVGAQLRSRHARPATQIVRPSESTAETQPDVQPALLRLSAMISPILHIPRRVGSCGLGFTAFASAALLAAHLAFIAAASCARRSGERFSFFFAFLAASFFASATRAAAERAADFLQAFNAFTACAASRLRFSSASFCGPSRRRLSSRLIPFLKSFIFMNVCSRTRGCFFHN